MKFLCYRGVVYKHIQEAINLMRIERFPKAELASQSAPRSMRVLCYRGVFYLREVRPAPNSEPATLRLTQEQYRSMQLDQRNRTMQDERMGYLYKLYCIGWRNGSIKHFSQLQHWLLNSFSYYRRGFAEGAEWRQDQIRKP